MSDGAKRMVLLLGALLLPAVLVASWAGAASRRLKESAGAASGVAVASVSDDSYCTPQLKAVVRRVAGACGLVQAGSGGRGCQPMEARKVASLSGGDFNALFRPLSKRAHLIQFDAEKSDLDESAQALLEKSWSDQRGASFFFVVARASPDGSGAYNELLSRDRANAVLKHLEDKFHDPDIQKQVGLLWLGADFAQLGDEFCGWSRSREVACTATDINRSAFVAWIDCAI